MPILSICIPTYNRPLILKNVLESIFSQNVNSDLYEVCISDNSKSDDTKQIIDTYFPDKKNLIYNHSDCEGFYNSIESLKLGKGSYLKLNNDTGIFRPNSLDRLITTLKKNIDSVIFFTMSEENDDASISRYKTFDSFLYDISYLSTWSSAFCIAKHDFQSLIQTLTQVDKMFPHTSLLYSLIDKSNYIVDRYKYIDTFDVNKKGGYNIPEVFGERYLKMTETLLQSGAITKKTNTKIRKDILHFIVEWYIKVKENKQKYTFDFSNKEKHIANCLGKFNVIMFYYFALKLRFEHLKVRVKRKIKKILGK